MCVCMGHLCAPEPVLVHAMSRPGGGEAVAEGSCCCQTSGLPPRVLLPTPVHTRAPPAAAGRDGTGQEGLPLAPCGQAGQSLPAGDRDTPGTRCRCGAVPGGRHTRSCSAPCHSCTPSPDGAARPAASRPRRVLAARPGSRGLWETLEEFAGQPALPGASRAEGAGPRRVRGAGGAQC